VISLAALTRLIDHWFPEGDLASVCRYDEIALAIDSEALRTIKAHLDIARDSSRRQLEIEFQASFVAVIDQVRSGIDIGIAYALEGRQLGMPLFRVVTYEIIYGSRKQPLPGDSRIRGRLNERHAKKTAFCSVAGKQKLSLILFEKSAKALSLSEELCIGTGLSAVGLESKRQKIESSLGSCSFGFSDLIRRLRNQSSRCA
jgi:hypothetical protein